MINDSNTWIFILDAIQNEDLRKEVTRLKSPLKKLKAAEMSEWERLRSQRFFQWTLKATTMGQRYI